MHFVLVFYVTEVCQSTIIYPPRTSGMFLHPFVQFCPRQMLIHLRQFLCFAKFTCTKETHETFEKQMK